MFREEHPPVMDELGCGECLFEAARSCGIAGAARCALLERAAVGERPSEWVRGKGRSLACLSFEPAFCDEDVSGDFGASLYPGRAADSIRRRSRFVIHDQA